MGHEGLGSISPGGTAVVIGATGGIGAAVCDALGATGRFARIHRCARSPSDPDMLQLDLTDEASIAAAAERVRADGGDLRLVFDAAGVLHAPGMQPEKTWRALDPDVLARAFAINAIGPALVMKHFLPLLAREGKAVFATLSAKVGSIGDNHTGGWWAYMASKAALSQFVRTAAHELARRAPEAVCLALHPGTVSTSLSAPFAKTGLTVREPETAARDLLRVIDGLDARASGGSFSWDGARLPW